MLTGVAHTVPPVCVCIPLSLVSKLSTLSLLELRIPCSRSGEGESKKGEGNGGVYSLSQTGVAGSLTDICR